eukprot:445147-Prymnesium_polylepis.1
MAYPAESQRPERSSSSEADWWQRRGGPTEGRPTRAGRESAAARALCGSGSVAAARAARQAEECVGPKRAARLAWHCVGDVK